MDTLDKNLWLAYYMHVEYSLVDDSSEKRDTNRIRK